MFNMHTKYLTAFQIIHQFIEPINLVGFCQCRYSVTYHDIVVLNISSGNENLELKSACARGHGARTLSMFEGAHQLFRVKFRLFPLPSVYLT